MSTKITYNGKTTELADGYIATFPCKGFEMETDVVVEAPEPAESVGSSINVQPLTVTENGTYDAPEGQAYDPVTVDVKPITEPITITENGVYPVPKGGGLEFGKEVKFKKVITAEDCQAYIAKAGSPETVAGAAVYYLGCRYFLMVYNLGDTAAYYLHWEDPTAPLYAIGLQAVNPSMPVDGWWLMSATGEFTSAEPPTVIFDESLKMSADLATTAVFFDIETKSLDGWGEITVNIAPLPIEVSTEAEMTALLTSGEVGGVYKYTGTTGTYENGALYVLENATITFTVGSNSFEAEEGMTWSEWCDSEYNTDGYSIQYSTVRNGNTQYHDYITLNNARVSPTDIIIGNTAYGLEGWSSGGSNE